MGERRREIFINSCHGQCFNFTDEKVQSLSNANKIKQMIDSIATNNILSWDTVKVIWAVACE